MTEADLTLGYLSLPDTPPADLIEIAAKAGFRSVGIRITGRYLDDAFPKIVGNSAAIRELKQKSRDSGVRLSNISAYYMRGDVKLQDMVSIVEATAELGSSMIVANRHDPDDARYFENLAGYCEAAARAGIKLAVECMRYSEVKSLQQATEIIARAAQPNLGLILDPLHLKRCGNDYGEIKNIDPASIALAQLCDARLETPYDIVKEARTGRLLPGEGELPLFEFLDALPQQAEIECEIPSERMAHLPALERAQRIYDATTSFLNFWQQQS